MVVKSYLLLVSDLLRLLHLCNQILLVPADAGRVDGDGSVITDPDLLRNLVDQTEVVGDQDDTAAEGVDGASQGIDTPGKRRERSRKSGKQISEPCKHDVTLHILSEVHARVCH